jgi:hypothetical protein
VDGREGTLGLDVAEHLAGGGVDHRDAVGRSGAQGDPSGDEVAAAGQVAIPTAAPQLPHRHHSLGSLSPAHAKDLVVVRPERRLVGGRQQVLHLDLLRAVVENRRLDRPLQELVRVAAEELVERVLPSDVDGEASAPPAGAPPHLAQAGDRAREVDADRRIELADVDPELERVGCGDREQVPRGELRLDLAALLRRVAGAVRSDSVGQLAPALLRELHRSEPVDQLDSAAAAHEADRPHPV